MASLPFTYVSGSIILVDGAPVGIKTFSVVVETDDQEIIDQLGQICDREGIGFEDWTTVRILCKQCSEGIPHEQHDHDNEALSDEVRTFGLAAVDKDSIERILQEWSDLTDTTYSEIGLEME